MDVSVIIVNYNTKKLTNECINSIFCQTYGVSYEVILVDNASTDGSVETFEKDNRIRFVKSDKNLGFGRANNLGFQYASGKYLFLLNSDTLLLNNAIYEFFVYLESSPNRIGCVGCELIDEVGVPSYSFGIFPNIKFFLGKILGEYYINPSFFSFPNNSSSKHPLIVDYSSGADMFIRHSVVDTCGLFDPDFFMYFEEVEMQHRFRENGFFSQIIETPKIAHLTGGSGLKKGKNTSARIKIIELESRFIYSRKVFSTTKYMLISLLHLMLITRVLLYKFTWSEKKLLLSVIIRNICRQKGSSIFFL